jgi:hypothetical protein
LEKESLVPGTSFRLLEKAPFHGPLKLILSGRNAPHYIGLEAAKNIYVSTDRPGANPKRLAARGPDHALRSYPKHLLSGSSSPGQQAPENLLRRLKRKGGAR